MSCDFSALANIDTTDPDQVAALMQQCTSVVFDPMLWVWAIVFTIVCAVVGGWIGTYKKAVVRDAILGATLGPIGWIISLCLPVRAQQCAQCGTRAPGVDRFCRRCGHTLQPGRVLQKP